MKKAKVVTNEEYAKGKVFVELCKKHGVTPTRRQASKYRNKRGMLWNAEHPKPLGSAE